MLIIKELETLIQAEGTFKMVEEQDVEITFLPTNTSKTHLRVELLQNTY